MILIIIIVVGILIVLSIISPLVIYNSLIRGRNTCTESWADVDTELKRRYDLIPNLVETVKGYAAHERETLEQVTQARNAAVASTGSPESQAKDENVLVKSLRQLLAVAENYPDLKASKNFLDLQHELTNTEDRIQRARRFYNGNVRDYNNRVQMFPSNMIARMAHCEEREFFEIENVIERQAPEVKI
jgi:LemA protein